MHVAYLSLTDFRSYHDLELAFDPGISVLVGPNGSGKTNVVEAIGYMGALTSHRVSGDVPLISAGAGRAVVKVRLAHGDRTVNLAVEIAQGKTGPCMVNGVPARRRRDLAGISRSVVFAPEDLALVKGDPAVRRGFLDNVLVQTSARWAAELGDYERVAKQRATLLKSLGAARRAGRRPDERTLDVWDAHLAEHGAKITVARQDVVAALAPPTREAYRLLASNGQLPEVTYAATTDEMALLDGQGDNDKERTAAHAELLYRAMALVRDKEIDRGVNLVGPHRDDLRLTLGGLPARGYASHGESWSLALALKLGAFEILRDGQGGTPVLILDDVFAELDAERRATLAAMVGIADQVFITAAVPGDIPASLDATVFTVAGGQVHRAA
ncbi:MAG: DNA replication/repair protein RecF [Bifidobacteriaceae bacterium]|jgi:DNA replication and repair protein RecF|nr:DNA replication/repair protein RecF [Bifidobacteriaceae bacterium]